MKTETYSLSEALGIVKVPVCECDNMRCRIPLGIDWETHAAKTREGVLIARDCKTPIPMELITLEHHRTYSVKLNVLTETPDCAAVRKGMSL